VPIFKKLDLNISKDTDAHAVCTGCWLSGNCVCLVHV